MLFIRKNAQPLNSQLQKFAALTVYVCFLIEAFGIITTRGRSKYREVTTNISIRYSFNNNVKLPKLDSRNKNRK